MPWRGLRRFANARRMDTNGELAPIPDEQRFVPDKLAIAIGDN